MNDMALSPPHSLSPPRKFSPPPRFTPLHRHLPPRSSSPTVGLPDTRAANTPDRETFLVEDAPRGWRDANKFSDLPSGRAREFFEGPPRNVSEKRAGEEAELECPFQRIQANVSNCQCNILQGELERGFATLRQEIQILRENHSSLSSKVDSIAASTFVSVKDLGTLREDLDVRLRSERDVHAQHQHVMRERVDYLQKLVGDSIANNAKEFEVSSKRLQDALGRMEVEKEARESRQASDTRHFLDLESHNDSVAHRLEQLEQYISAERLEGIEKYISVSVEKHEKHVKALEVANTKLGDIHAHMHEEKESREHHHAMMKHRLECLERLVADRNVREVAAAHRERKDLHDYENHYTTMGHISENLDLNTPSPDNHEEHPEELEVAYRDLAFLEEQSTQLSIVDDLLACERERCSTPPPTRMPAASLSHEEPSAALMYVPTTAAVGFVPTGRTRYRGQWRLSAEVVPD